MVRAFFVRFALLVSFTGLCVSASNDERSDYENRQDQLEKRMTQMQKEMTRSLLLLEEKMMRELADKSAITMTLLNDTAELEGRVEDLEIAMVEVQDDVSELETDVSFIDGRLLNLETDVALINENLINVETDVSDNEDAIFEIVLNVDTLQETAFVHQEQISALQDSDVQLDERITILEDSVNGSIPSNTTDLEIRVSVLESTVSEQSVSINNLQETDAEFELRIEDLEDYIIGEWTACESSPCDNGASCVDVNVDTFVCACRDGYFGITCSESYKDTLFLATFIEYSISPVPDPLIFDETRINPGGHYDNTTGIYTVPIDGTYQFYVQIENNVDDNNDWDFYLMIDASAATFTRHEASGSTASEQVSQSSTILLSLSAGQQVWVDPNGLDGLYGSSSVDQLFSWFSGIMISAD